MTDKLNNPQVFPELERLKAGEVEVVKVIEKGITLRDYFATHCPIGMLEAWAVWTKRSYKELAKESEREGFFAFWAMLRNEYADAMLKERAK